jgi:hypothetical protein
MRRKQKNFNPSLELRVSPGRKRKQPFAGIGRARYANRLHAITFANVGVRRLPMPLARAFDASSAAPPVAALSVFPPVHFRNSRVP